MGGYARRAPVDQQIARTRGAVCGRMPVFQLV